MTKQLSYAGLGIVFGFALSQVRASEFDAIYGMFRGTDLTLAWVMVIAIIIGHLGMRLASSSGSMKNDWMSLRQQAGGFGVKHLVGSASFGVGWALSGACPGTVLAQLGEGKFYALFTVTGLMAGTWVYALVMEKWLK